MGRGILGALHISKAWEAVCESTPPSPKKANHLLPLQFLALGGICQWVPIPDRFLKRFSTSGEDSLIPAMGTPPGAAAAGAGMCRVDGCTGFAIRT